ncbi:hypothetical protein SAMN05660909_02596 [Chitinophaga terrae (ex Kim and Jung 2007)]|uniref:Uncharacterized protein n=2 Tax=Chitinophaga terrae (ex Kim and Jung 2007) TaxID=408074 RepID=A0A1H4CEQ2_9BACT|nr:hypothetical protein SAMN05660909_02596 [Chitinophaga terrae (ex Kim and Jung 2007)]
MFAPVIKAHILATTCLYKCKNVRLVFMTKHKVWFLVVMMLMISICYRVYLSDRYSNADARILNHVKFKGEIISLNISGNHAYGIIGIAVSTTNKSEYVATVQSVQFPYSLSQGYAEFYGYVPVETKIGFNIELDSDKGIMRIYDNGRLVKETNVAVSMERRNIEFVRQHSKFRFINPK